MVGMVLKKVWFACKENSKDWIVLSSASGIIVIGIQSLVDFNLHLPLLGFVLAFFMAVIMSNSFGHGYLTSESITKGIWIPWSITQFLLLVSVSFSTIARQSIDKETWFKMALPFSHARGDLYADFARFHYEQKNYLEAVRFYQQAIQKKPKYPFYYTELGDTYVQLREWESAAKAYKKAIEIEPFYILAYHQFGTTLLALKDKKKAIQSFKLALQIYDLHLKTDSDYTKRLVEFDPEFTKMTLKNL
jgi:hypothetical protein